MRRTSSLCQLHDSHSEDAPLIITNIPTRTYCHGNINSQCTHPKRSLALVWAWLMLRPALRLLYLSRLVINLVCVLVASSVVAERGLRNPLISCVALSRSAFGPLLFCRSAFAQMRSGSNYLSTWQKFTARRCTVNCTSRGLSSRRRDASGGARYGWLAD